VRQPKEGKKEEGRGRFANITYQLKCSYRKGRQVVAVGRTLLKCQLEGRRWNIELNKKLGRALSFSGFLFIERGKLERVWN